MRLLQARLFKATAPPPRNRAHRAAYVALPGCSRRKFGTSFSITPPSKALSHCPSCRPQRTGGPHPKTVEKLQHQEELFESCRGHESESTRRPETRERRRKSEKPNLKVHLALAPPVHLQISSILPLITNLRNERLANRTPGAMQSLRLLCR